MTDRNLGEIMGVYNILYYDLHTITLRELGTRIAGAATAEMTR